MNDFFSFLPKLDNRSQTERFAVYFLLSVVALDCCWAISVDARSYFWGIKPSPFDNLAGNFGFSVIFMLWTSELIRKKSNWAFLVGAFALFRIAMAIEDYWTFFRI